MEQYYLRARYYNPVLGRFMQEDVYQGDGLNRYAYCRNNSVVNYDPSGYGCKETDKINDNSDEIKACYDPDLVIKLYESQDLKYEVIVLKKFENGYRTKEEYQAAYTNRESRVLRQQLEMCGVHEPPFPNEAHHIVPINQAPKAIEHLVSLGIDGNSAVNGVG